MSRSAVPPSGRQFEIVHGDQRAAIVEVGAGIRAYETGGREVLDSYPIDVMSDGAHGAVLAPWPNRLGDGRYTFDGTDHQLALTEPEKDNAIHGLVRWRSWRAAEQTASRVLMTTTLHPMTGYPFCLDLGVEYSLGDDGLVVTTTATNVGTTPCPYGSGQHPYLSPGSDLVDDCLLQFQAGTRIVTDAERQLPTGTESVAGTAFDFSEPRRLADLEVDFAFTDLIRDSDGRAWIRLTGADGRTVEMWLDESYPVLEVYTGDTLAPSRRRHGLGAEPMTCPPNALHTHDGVQRLEPGQSTSARWGVRLA